jgi:hypothetical protein
MAPEEMELTDVLGELRLAIGLFAMAESFLGVASGVVVAVIGCC